MPRRCWRARATCTSTRPVSDRVYGLDGNIRVVRNEVNENGVLEPLTRRDACRIYFGMRRGGSEYYGIDVTEPQCADAAVPDRPERDRRPSD